MIAYYIYPLVFIAFFVLINLYFKIADKFNIIDKPNERSSHTEITIRGGGIVFYLAGLIYFIYSGFQHPIFFLGLTGLAVISFLDDIYDLPSKLRLGVHLLAIVSLLLFEFIWVLHQYTGIYYTLFSLVCFVIMVGVINAYNFMDGINGITGVYSLVLLVSLAYINRMVLQFSGNELIYFSILAVLVFNVYNFRKKAKCFAGDVGSVSMAFIILFLVGNLIFRTENYAYILLLGVYGVDTVLTIFHRLLNKENILEAHRSHLYQFMVHIGKISHLKVASIYGIVQLLLNILLIYCIQMEVNVWLVSGGILVSLATFYIILKRHYLIIQKL